MAFSHDLAKAGTPPTTLDTTAAVTFVPGTGITQIVLSVVGTVPGMSLDAFRQAAEAAKEGCPVSQALKGRPDHTGGTPHGVRSRTSCSTPRPPQPPPHGVDVAAGWPAEAPSHRVLSRPLTSPPPNYTREGRTGGAC